MAFYVRIQIINDPKMGSYTNYSPYVLSSEICARLLGNAYREGMKWIFTSNSLRREVMNGILRTEMGNSIWELLKMY